MGGATVITNLASAVPYIGLDIVQWIWGGFTVSNPTLTRFFSFHFICPFVISALVIVHLIYLHQTGSNNPIGTNRNLDKLSFHPFFTIKDFFGFIVTLFLFAYAILRSIPNKLGGVIAMLLSIIIWFTLPLFTCKYKFQSNKFLGLKQTLN